MEKTVFFQYQQLCGITPMLAQLLSRNISPTVIIYTYGHCWSNVVNQTDQKLYWTNDVLLTGESALMTFNFGSRI
jgi:hypothetical protein